MVIENVWTVCPDVNVTDGGNEMPVAADERATVVPDAGAPEVSVTFPVAEPPPVIVPGEIVIVERDWATANIGQSADRIRASLVFFIEPSCRRGLLTSLTSVSRQLELVDSVE